MSKYTEEIKRRRGVVFLGRASWSVYFPTERRNGTDTRSTLSGYYGLEKSVDAEMDLVELIGAGIVVIDHRHITWESACESIRLPMIARDESEIDGDEGSLGHVSPARYRELALSRGIGGAYWNCGES